MNDKNNPFLSTVLEHTVLTKPGAFRTTYHISLDLSENSNTYQPGDSLGIIPHNDSVLVNRIILALNGTPDEKIIDKSGIETTTFNILKENLDLQKAPLNFWKKLKEKCSDSEEQNLLKYYLDNKNEKLNRFKDITDKTQRKYFLF